MDKKQIKRLQKFIDANMTTILNIRARIIDSGPMTPNHIYISDHIIWDNKSSLLDVNKRFFDTEITAYGMKIFLDYRVPVGQFFLTYGSLEDN